MPLLVLGTRVLKYSVLGPSRYEYHDSWFNSHMCLWGPGPARSMNEAASYTLTLTKRDRSCSWANIPTGSKQPKWVHLHTLGAKVGIVYVLGSFGKHGILFAPGPSRNQAKKSGSSLFRLGIIQGTSGSSLDLGQRGFPNGGRSAPVGILGDCCEC